MNSTKEQYTRIAGIVYVINGAHKSRVYDKHVTVTFEENNIVTLTVLKNNDVICVTSTNDADRIIETLTPYLEDVKRRLSIVNEKRRDSVSRMISGARDYAISQGFDLAQEAWNNIFNECMENFNELEEM